MKTTASTYVEFDRASFEKWINTHGYEVKRKGATSGVYQMILTPSIAIEVSSSLGGDDKVVDKGEGSMQMRLVSTVTGATLNKKAQEVTRFNRTKNWRITLTDAVRRFVNVYEKSKPFYDAVAVIEDRVEYRESRIEYIEGIPGWENNNFLSNSMSILRENGVLTTKQEDILRKIKTESLQDMHPLVIARALYLISKKNGDGTVEGTATIVANLVKKREKIPKEVEEDLRILRKKYFKEINLVIKNRPEILNVG